MYKSTIQALFSGEFQYFQPGLYIVGDGETVFYIGISRSDVTERLLSHFGLSDRWRMFVPTLLRPFIELNMPKANSFWVAAYSQDEALELCDRPCVPDLDSVELALIEKLSPALNKVNNRNPGLQSGAYIWPKSIFGFDTFQGIKEINNSGSNNLGGIRMLARYLGVTQESLKSLQGYRAITSDHIYQFKDWALIEGYKIDSVNTALVDIRHYARRAFEQGIIDGAQYVGIASIPGIGRRHAEFINQRRPKIGRKERRTTPLKITRKMVESLIDSCEDTPRGKRDKALLRLLAYHKTPLSTVVKMTMTKAASCGLSDAVKELGEGKGADDLLFFASGKPNGPNPVTDVSDMPATRFDINYAVKVLGRKIGIDNLTPLDLKAVK